MLPPPPPPPPPKNKKILYVMRAIRRQKEAEGRRGRVKKFSLGSGENEVSGLIDFSYFFYHKEKTKIKVFFIQTNDKTHEISYSKCLLYCATNANYKSMLYI